MMMKKEKLSENIYKNLDNITQKLRFTLPFPMLAYPFCLWGRSPGKTGSHFDPNSDLFVLNERNDVITSTVCWTAMAALLVCLSFVMGPIQMFKLYGIPYWIYVMWQDLVTYLHHHAEDRNEDFVDVLLNLEKEDKLSNSDMIAVLWDVAKEITGELQAKPDLIIGNYSEGNLVASLLAHKLGITRAESVPLATE
ncbi:hypothetical protein F0562_020236 [Nyssa sinensis]|uniref:Sucrose synthase first GT-B domain-containing protein n=1 Tax=Nyssa sinensis TaxID=561372 RepID=A0A5J5BV46_9ASTE|nr:hypothetical protein F0562_020236 [Nyssa sinensis]